MDKLRNLEFADRINAVAADAAALHFAVAGIGAVYSLTRESDPVAEMAIRIKEKLHEIAEELSPDPDAEPTDPAD